MDVKYSSQTPQLEFCLHYRSARIGETLHQPHARSRDRHASFPLTFVKYPEELSDNACTVEMSRSAASSASELALAAFVRASIQTNACARAGARVVLQPLRIPVEWETVYIERTMTLLEAWSSRVFFSLSESLERSLE